MRGRSHARVGPRAPAYTIVTVIATCFPFLFSFMFSPFLCKVSFLWRYKCVQSLQEKNLFTAASATDRDDRPRSAHRCFFVFLIFLYRFCGDTNASSTYKRRCPLLSAAVVIVVVVVVVGLLVVVVVAAAGRYCMCLFGAIRRSPVSRRARAAVFPVSVRARVCAVCVCACVVTPNGNRSSFSDSCPVHPK